jgi:hypothetical protein
MHPNLKRFALATLSTTRDSTDNATSHEPTADLLFLQWLVYCGVLLFACYLLWRANVWGLLIGADPTGITMMIVAVFVAATVWVGKYCLKLSRERHAVQVWTQAARLHAATTQSFVAPTLSNSHVHQYFSAWLEKLRHTPSPSTQLTDVLAERLQGPSESAWWVNGIQIKMGLLGKVIGFSILAIQLSQIQSFDPSQSQTLLKTLTGGLGIALLTTAVGLLANMLLGMQLVKLDRCADQILADAVEFAETKLPTLVSMQTSHDETQHDAAVMISLGDIS